MQNLIPSNFASIHEKQVLYISNSDYLKVTSGKMIKIDRLTSTMIGRRFKLCSKAGYGFYYLRNVIGEYGYFRSHDA